MPRKTPGWETYNSKVEKAIISETFINGLNKSPQKLPLSSTVRNELEQIFSICSNRQFRVVLVEDYGDYKVFIQIPDGKSECDFYVWYAKFVDKKLAEFKVPTHDDLAKWYNRLKELSDRFEEYLINAVLRLIRDRESVKNIVERYFSELGENLKLDASKFLSTLKWIALQEDTNYPPPKRMGSKYTLAVYALLEAGFNMSEIRRIIKF